MHTLVLAGEQLSEFFFIHLEKMAEPLPNVSIKGQVRTILHAALDDHVTKFNFLAWSDLKLEQFVTTLFKLDRRHNYKVNGLP